MKPLSFIIWLVLASIVQAANFLSFTAIPEPLPSAGNILTKRVCDNSSLNRSCWGSFDTSTNYYEEAPDTGVTRTFYLTIANATLSPDGVDKIVQVVNGTYPGPTIYPDWEILLSPTSQTISQPMAPTYTGMGSVKTIHTRMKVLSRSFSVPLLQTRPTPTSGERFNMAFLGIILTSACSLGRGSLEGF